MNSSFSLRNLLVATFTCLVILIMTNTRTVTSIAVGHSHHNKRQSINQAPMLTLDVEPHAGILPAHAQTAAVPDYFFPVEAGLFNFTCTIKHPSYFNKLVITRERLLNNGERAPPEDLIDASGYVLSTAIKDPRISIEFFDPSQLTFLDPSVPHLRASLLIKGLKLEDNAIYTCKYSTITKKINTIVYKQVTQKDIVFPSAKPEKFLLKQPTSVSCQVNDVYPKPKISFIAPNRDDLSKSIEEKDISKEPAVDANVINLYAIQSTLQFTPEYSDNGQFLNCTVTSHSATNASHQKGMRIQVDGNQIIEDKCAEYYTTKVSDTDFKIECVYFSNPRSDAFFEVEEEDLGEDVESTPQDQEDQVDKTKKEKQTKTVEIKDGDDNIPNYSLAIEKYGDAKSGLFKAVLTIKEVAEKNLKVYKFKLEDIERDIRLGTAKDIKKELSTKGEESSATSLFRIHSTVFTAFTIVLVFLRLF